MSKKKSYDFGPGETNEETTDQAAEGGNDHNEALAQRPGDGSETSGQQDDQAAIEALRRASEANEKLVQSGQSTTTTPDSVTGQTASTSDSPGDLDKLTVDERLERVRGWAKGKRTRPPMGADWQELDEILGSNAAGEARRP